MHARHSTHLQGDGLADILERVLDKGIVIAGDVSVAVAGIELLTLKIRLVVTTVDKALEMGIDWWQHDPMISSSARPRQLAGDPHASAPAVARPTADHAADRAADHAVAGPATRDGPPASGAGGG